MTASDRTYNRLVFQIKSLEEFLYSEKPYKVSMFANFTGIPGAHLASMIERDRDEVEDIASDFSSANIALFCLPLVLSVPPISLIRH